MNNDEIKIAIAEACGWTKEKIAARLDYELAERQMRGAEISTDEYYRRHLRIDPIPAVMPDFLNDLNAMYEAEKTLTKQQAADYSDLLFHATSGEEAAWFFNLAHSSSQLPRPLAQADGRRRMAGRDQPGAAQRSARLFARRARGLHGPGPGDQLSCGDFRALARIRLKQRSASNFTVWGVSFLACARPVTGLGCRNMALIIPNKEDVLRSQLSDISGAVQALSSKVEAFVESDFASRPSDRKALDAIRSDVADLLAFTQADPTRVLSAPRRPATAISEDQGARSTGKPAQVLQPA